MDNSLTKIKKYQLKNLDCANCAQRIEDGVKELSEVNFASVNFATATLHLDTQDLGAVERLIEKIEPAVQVLLAEEISPVEDGHNHREAVILSLAGGLFVLGLALTYFWVEMTQPWLAYLVFGLAYLLSGTDVLLRAVKNSA